MNPIQKKIEPTKKTKLFFSKIARIKLATARFVQKFLINSRNIFKSSFIYSSYINYKQSYSRKQQIKFLVLTLFKKRGGNVSHKIDKMKFLKMKKIFIKLFCFSFCKKDKKLYWAGKWGRSRIKKNSDCSEFSGGVCILFTWNLIQNLMPGRC